MHLLALNWFAPMKGLKLSAKLSLQNAKFISRLTMLIWLIAYAWLGRMTCIMSNEKDNKALNQKLEEAQKPDPAKLLKELVDNLLKTNPADGAERNETIMTYKAELNKTEKDYRNARQRIELRYGKIAIKRLNALANVLANVLDSNPFAVGPDLLNMPDEEFDKFVEDLKKKIEDYEDYRSKSTSKSDWIEQVTKHDVQG